MKGQEEQGEKESETLEEMLDRVGWGPSVMDENDHFFRCARGMFALSDKTDCNTPDRTLRCINKFSGKCDVFLKDGYHGEHVKKGLIERDPQRYHSCLRKFGEGKRFMEVRKCLHDFTNDLNLKAPNASNDLYGVWIQYCNKYVCHDDPKMRAEAKQSCGTWTQPKIYHAYCNELCSSASWSATYFGHDKDLNQLAQEADAGWPTLKYAREYHAAQKKALIKAQQSYRHKEKLPELEKNEEEARKLLVMWEQAYQGYEGKKSTALQAASTQCFKTCESNVVADVWSGGVSASSLLKFNLQGSTRGWKVAMTKFPPGLRDSSMYELPDQRNCKNGDDDDWLFSHRA